MGKRLMTVAVGILAVVAMSKPANASHDSSCVVSSVMFANDTWGHAFFFSCTSGVNYYVYLGGGGSGCINGTLDDIKLYEPIALAAKLAGKSVQVDYTTSTCSGTSVRNVQSIQIQN